MVNTVVLEGEKLLGGLGLDKRVIWDRSFFPNMNTTSCQKSPISKSRG